LVLAIGSGDAEPVRVGCQDSPVADTSPTVRSAELSSLASALDDLTRRVTVHADTAQAAEDEEMARELFAIERSLNSANRRLTRLATALRR
jgi:hypothetical protein